MQPQRAEETSFWFKARLMHLLQSRVNVSPVINHVEHSFLSLFPSGTVWSCRTPRRAKQRSSWRRETSCLYTRNEKTAGTKALFSAPAGQACSPAASWRASRRSEPANKLLMKTSTNEHLYCHHAPDRSGSDPDRISETLGTASSSRFIS